MPRTARGFVEWMGETGAAYGRSTGNRSQSMMRAEEQSGVLWDAWRKRNCEIAQALDTAPAMLRVALASPHG